MVVPLTFEEATKNIAILLVADENLAGNEVLSDI